MTDDRETQCVHSLNRDQNPNCVAHRRKFDVHGPMLDCGARANACGVGSSPDRSRSATRIRASPQRSRSAPAAPSASSSRRSKTSAADYQTNEFGDRLIVSHARLPSRRPQRYPPSRSLSITKGAPSTASRCTSQPARARTRRARGFFHDPRQARGIPPAPARPGHPQARSQNHVQGSSLTLDDVRRMSRGQGPQGGGN